MKIVIATDFTDTPGGRNKVDGPFSGEEFREKFLVPALNQALSTQQKLVIDLNNLYGYPVGFLEEAYGGLRIYFSPEEILNTLDFKLDDDIKVIDTIIEFIKSSDRDNPRMVYKNK